MNTRRTVSILIFLILLSTVGIAVSQQKAYENAHEYKKEYEQVNAPTPAHKVEVNGTEYWPFEITGSQGNIKLIVPINSDTGEVAIENQKKIIETHYIANFFEKTDSVEDYLQSAEEFSKDIQQTFSSKKSELENTYAPQVENRNVTLQTMEPLQSSLKEALSKSKELKSMVSQTRDDLDEIDNPQMIFTSYQSMLDTLDKDSGTLNSVKNSTQRAGDFKQEVTSKSDSLGTDLARDLRTIIAEQVEDKGQLYSGREDTINNNEDNIVDFFDSTEEKVEGYRATLNERINMTQIEKERVKVLNQLNKYSNQLNDITNKSGSDDIPDWYLEQENFKVLVNETSDLIENSQENCSEEENLTETCLPVKNNYDKIEGNLEKLNNTVASYEPKCQEGETRECTVNNKKGVEKCVNGHWSECQPTEGEGGINWTLIGGLSAILIVLIIYKFKDRLFGGGEEHEEKEKGMEEMWGKGNY